MKYIGSKARSRSMWPDLTFPGLNLWNAPPSPEMSALDAELRWKRDLDQGFLAEAGYNIHNVNQNRGTSCSQQLTYTLR